MPYLAFCAIAKDEDPFLEEWIAYHTLLGVEAFYIYDHESSTPIAESLAHLVEQGFVHVFRVSGHAQQLPSYNHCLSEFGKDFHWIGFFDLDEFLVPKHVDDLRVMLTEYERYAGLGVNWVGFGTNGHVHRPEGLLSEHYTRACKESDWNDHIKCFIRPPKVSAFTRDPHFPSFRLGGVPVNERFQAFWGPRSPFSQERCQINHYYFKSVEDYRHKLSRGAVMGSGLRAIDPVPEGDIPDLAIQRFVPRLKELIALGPEALAELACAFAKPRTEAEAFKLASEYTAKEDFDNALALLCNACQQHTSSRRLARMKERLVRQRFSFSWAPVLRAYATCHLLRIGNLWRKMLNQQSPSHEKPQT